MAGTLLLHRRSRTPMSQILHACRIRSRNVKKILVVAAASVIAVAGSSHALDRLDGIAAVVGDSMILTSELDAYVMMRTTAGGASAAPDSASLPKLRKQYL